MPFPPGGYFGGYYGGFFGGGGATPVATEELLVTPPVVLAAQNRLSQQFRTKPKILATLAALVAPLQPIADAIADLIAQQAIDVATDTQLDVLGSKIGQPRDGLLDTVYRKYLRARVATNRSDGTAEDLITIANLVIGIGSGAIVNPQTQQVATCDVQITGGYVPDDDTTTALLAFLKEGVAAGVRLLLEVLTAVESDSFTCATNDTTLSSAATAGDTTLTVVSTDGFPPKGSLDIDTNLAVAETVTYDGVLATKFLNVSALAHNHLGPSGSEGGACVQLSTDPGKGFGDDVDLTAGGQLVEVLE